MSSSSFVPRISMFLPHGPSKMSPKYFLIKFTYLYGMVNLCFDCRIVTSCLEANAVNFQIAYEGDF